VKPTNGVFASQQWWCVMESKKRTSADKIRLFRSLFSGLENVYGTYDVKTGRVRQVKEPVTNDVIRAHLKGIQSYGVYLLTGEKTSALVVDFDEDELGLPLCFAAGARRCGMTAYIERSKSKGYHAWFFFNKGGVPARKARLVAQKLLSDMGRQGTEVFPKQDALVNGVSYGNFIHAPLFGSLVRKGRTVFIDPDEPTRAHPDQWEVLEGVQRVSESKLDAIIQNCELKVSQEMAKLRESNEAALSNGNTSPFGLPPCARKMLAEGVVSYQRVSCFRLAVHMKRYGLPYDLAVAALKAWAQKNHPGESKRIITDREIEYQAKCAFENSYRSFGCEDPAISAHCDKDCPLYAHTVGKSSIWKADRPQLDWGLEP